MNVRHPMDVLHSFSIKSIFYDKMDLILFCFEVTIYGKPKKVVKNTVFKGFTRKYNLWF